MTTGLRRVEFDRPVVACDSCAMSSPAEAATPEPATDLPPHVLALVRHEHRAAEPELDRLLDALGHNGAREIWHKHGTFLDHLLGVWCILVAWKQPTDVCRLGLMHSIYSNSNVRMKVFDADGDDGRATVRRLVGAEAERLVHLFCVIRRDERLSWEAWVAWTRVLLKGARERSWPTDPLGIISLGEVRPGL